jgi:hypothetical protein
MEELEAEIDYLREKCETLQRNMESLKDEKETQSSEFEGKMDEMKHEVEREWKKKINEVEKNCRDQIAAMSNELDVMRNAFNGDASGWVIKKTKQGREYYENVDTGETRNEMPEILFIAEAMSKAEKAEEQLQELAQLREKIKDAEMKKREAEINLNKSRQEVNSLRVIEKGWKETSKSITKYIIGVSASFDTQVRDVIAGMDKLLEGTQRLKHKTPSVQRATFIIKKLQEKVALQDATIKQLNSKYRKLQSEADEKDEKIKRLSKGIDEEVERLVKSMREKTADCMVQVMKEKAARAQERRELADLWPDNVMMPTLLMKYRSLSEEERERRRKRSRDNDASRALAIEIRANMAESRMWTVQYDEYGRQFYQHSITGDTEWEEPAIMSYKPPPGRDEMGNITITDEELSKGWIMKCDAKGVVYYQSEATGEITYEPPNVFKKIPLGREPEMYIGESAHIVLEYIKSKIERHTAILKREELRAKLIADGTSYAVMEETLGPDPYANEDTDKLSKFQYDIETVEMLSNIFTSMSVKAKAKQPDEPVLFLDQREGINGYKNMNEINKILLEDGIKLSEVDVTEMEIESIRKVVKEHALREEILEKKLKNTRIHLKVMVLCRLVMNSANSLLFLGFFICTYESHGCYKKRRK